MKISGSNPTLTTASTRPFLPVLSPQVETATAGRFLGDQLGTLLLHVVAEIHI